MKPIRPGALSYVFCTFIACIGVILGLAHSEAGNEQAGVQELRERIVRAAGGEELLRSIKAILAEGGVVASARGDSGSYKRIWARGGRLRAETIYGRTTELRLLNGPQGWRGRNDIALVEARGVHLDSMLYQYRVLDLPFGLAEDRYKLDYVGKERFRGEEVDVLKLSDPPSPEVFVYVDAEGRIVKSLGIFTIESESTKESESTNETATLSAEFSDFRQVEGLVVPYAVTFYARDAEIARLTIERYTLNPGLDQVRFERRR